MPVTDGQLIALSAAGVGVVVHVPTDGLPCILHWGAELPGLEPDDLPGLLLARRPLRANNDVDVPVRLAVVPEGWTGWLGRPGVQGSRDGAAWSPRFTPTRATLDGSDVDGAMCHGPGRLVVGARDEEQGLGIEVELELLPTGLVRTRATLTNDGNGDYALGSLVLAYPVPAEASELLDFAGRWGRERAPQRRAFEVGTHLRENRRGRTGADSAFVLHAGTRGFGFGRGAVFATHVAHSGNHVHYAERVAGGQRVLGGGELLLPGEVSLAPGESYGSPWLYGSYGEGLDAVARRFHAHLRSRPRPVSAQRPVTLNVWEAVYFDHDLERLTALAERAARVGVERYVLDDGWFGARRDDTAGLGDWTVSPDVWPEGLHPLVQRVRALGMQFGLWFEPEMINADSDLARAHPDWIMAARSELPVESRHQQVLDLGIPQAYEHVRDSVLAILDEYDIDYVKWDHNRDLVEAGNRRRGGRAAVHAQTQAVYRLLDELRAARPNLEIESCSSGGSRVDLGVLERTDRVWVSDNIDPLDRQHMMRWTAQLVPPEYLGAHVASERSHVTGRRHDLSFRAGTAVFGHLGVEWDLTGADDDQLAELADWITFYKSERALLLAGDIVRMDTVDPAVLVHGVLAPDRSRAIFAVATLAGADSAPPTPVHFRGLTPDRRYRIRPLTIGSPTSGFHPPQWWADGCVLTGAALEHSGLAAPIVHPEQVVLVRVEAL